MKLNPKSHPHHKRPKQNNNQGRRTIAGVLLDKVQAANLTTVPNRQDPLEQCSFAASRTPAKERCFQKGMVQPAVAGA